MFRRTPEKITIALNPKALLIFLVFFINTPPAIQAQVFEEVHSFTDAIAANPSNKGRSPDAGIVQGSDGNFYGTTSGGGVNGFGTVFKMTPSGELTTLVEFTGNSGANIGSLPRAKLVQGSNGNFYGTTSLGGALGLGTIFMVTPTGTLTTMVEFTGSAGSSKGRQPNAELILASDGNFYGTTRFGGSGNFGTGFGTAFRMAPDGTFTTLVEFAGSETTNRSRQPEAALIQADDGNFYGTTSGELDDGDNGTVFRMTPAGELTTLVEFTDNGVINKGRSPEAALVQGTDGKLYGTTRNGGASGSGTVFKVTLAGSLTTLVEFTGGGDFNQGGLPESALVQADDGNFYGTTLTGSVFGPENFVNGTIFRMTPTGGLTTLVEFTQSESEEKGTRPKADLFQGDDGLLYGTTSSGGIDFNGTIFRVTPFGGLTTLVKFKNEGNGQGSRPEAPLIQGSDGDFYGTTEGDEGFDHGTVFSMTPEGLVTNLVVFTGDHGDNKGSRPIAGLVRGSDGNFYGTTSLGGINGLGTIFRVTPAGVLTTLIEFTGNTGTNKGSFPKAALFLSSDGNFYGTTEQGGGNGLGTVFLLTSTGILTTLVEFTGIDGVSKGLFPRASLIQDTAGNLYGSTAFGGTPNFGTIFKIDPAGALTTLVEFTNNGESNKGRNPEAPLLEASDGNFYGTTYYGGSNTLGTAFRMSPAGVLTTLAEFSFAAESTGIGWLPRGGLTQAGDGNFYGTTSGGGAHGKGIVFKMTPAGLLTALLDFPDPDGIPYGSMIEATDGALYGTTSGPAGSVYRLVFPGAPLFLAREPRFVGTTSAWPQIHVNAAGSITSVSVEYGTNGVDFPTTFSILTDLPSDSTETLGVMLPNLSTNTTYHYRFRATNTTGTTVSTVRTFRTLSPDNLSVLSNTFPANPPDAQAFLLVNITPSGTGGWRFQGEQSWRPSGTPVTGLPTGDRTIQFQPEANHIHPPPETISLTSGSASAINRTYYETDVAGTGLLTVTLKPEAITLGSIPASDRAQWRLLGEDENQWRDSGVSRTGLIPGDYLVECKTVAGRSTPVPASVFITENGSASLDITYFSNQASTGSQLAPVPFSIVTTDQTKPYAYSGQIRSETGTASGFVVMPQVVATAGHVVFNESTLSSAIGLEWLFQRDASTYEPEPRIPAGYYIFDDYAFQRGLENTPGEFSNTSQNLNVAAIYFYGEDAGRGGSGGYLASDSDENEFLLSTSDKMLVAYPVDGISPANRGRMHATAPSDISFTPAFDRTYTTSEIASPGGTSGGPLCVKHTDGAYYPAAILLGATSQTTVRAIDSRVVELFTYADNAANDRDNPVGGGITLTSITPIANNTETGALTVVIEPAAARASGANWKLLPESTLRLSSAQKGGLVPGTYKLEFPPITGFLNPSIQPVMINGGELTQIIFTYQAAMNPLDTWRLENFQTTSNTGDAADGADPDKDGVKNIDEFTAGTDPNNSGDFLEITVPTKSGGTFTVTLAGKAGRIYKLQRNLTLTGTWITVATQTTLASDGPVTLTDPSAPAGSAYYRIEVSLP